MDYVGISNFIAIIVAVLLLGFGLFLQYSDLKSVEYKLYESGRCVRRLLQSLKDNPDGRKYSEIIEEYSRATDPLPNHSSVDNEIFVTRNFSALVKDSKIGLCDYLAGLVKVAMLHTLPLILVYTITVIVPVIALILVGQWK